MASVLFKFGNQAAYDALATTGYDTNSLYFIEDTGRLYKGSVLMSEQAIFVSAVPEFGAAKASRIYVVTSEDSASLYVKGTTQMIQVGGGTIQPGAITNLDVFNSSLLATELTEGSTDNQLPTAKAVYDAIQAVAADVEALGDPVTGASAERNEDNNGTVITLTRASGTNPITVNVSDLFLTSAEYDSVLHTLKLYVQGVTEPVEVDLADLIPQAVTTEDVAISQPITMTVDVGNLKAGTELITSGEPTKGQMLITDMQDLLQKMFSEDINPTITQPSASITLTGAGAKEVGTQFTPSYSVGFNPGSYVIHYGDNKTKTQATEVTATSYSVTDTNSGSSTTQTGSFTAFTVEDSTNYRVNVTVQHSAGVVPETFLGSTYPDGQIQAGSKTAQSSTVTGYRNMWYGYKASGSEFATISALTSTDIKTLTTARSTSLPNSISCNNASQLIFAVPANINKKPTLNQVSPPVTVDLTGSYQIQIGGVNEHSPIAYDVYYVAFAVPASGETQYNITWGAK